VEQWLYTLILRCRSLFRSTRIERELDDELRFHVDRQVEQHLASGMSADEARRTAAMAVPFRVGGEAVCVEELPGAVSSVSANARDDLHRLAIQYSDCLVRAIHDVGEFLVFVLRRRKTVYGAFSLERIPRDKDFLNRDGSNSGG
jgi:hypothetical protein